MARIRTVKPEFWRDAKLLKCSRDARLLLIGLLNFSDDYGRMVYDPDQIKLDVFPLDNDLNVENLIGELTKQGILLIYQVEDRAYLLVRNFVKHQKVDKRTESKLPAPPEVSTESPRVAPTTPGFHRVPPNPAESHGVPTSSAESPRTPSTEGKGKEGKGTEGNTTAPPRKVGGTPEDEALARKMFAAIKVVVPTAKEPTWASWANAVRLMREQDDRTHEQIWTTFDWANRDSFWRVNILSPATLREKWDKLEAKRLGSKPAGDGLKNIDYNKGVGPDGQF